MLNSLLSFFKMVKTSKVQKKKDRKSKKCCQWDPERGVLMNWCHDDMKCGCRKLCEKHNSPCDALLQTVCLPLFLINKIQPEESSYVKTPKSSTPHLSAWFGAWKWMRGVVFFCMWASYINTPKNKLWPLAPASSPEDFAHLCLWFQFQPPLKWYGFAHHLRFEAERDL